MTKQVRDWHKDMEMIDACLEYRHLSFYPEQNLAGEPVVILLHHWLQQYAAEKERADTLLGANQFYQVELAESLGREKKLREAIEKAMYLINAEAFRLAYDALQECLASLYPEEGETK